MPRPFPVLTPQSYIPGGVGAAGLPGLYPNTGGRPFPSLGPNAYLPPPTGFDPPVMNYSNGPSFLSPSASFPSMMQPSMPSIPPPLPPPQPQPSFSYPNPMQMMSPPVYNPGPPSYSRQLPVRYCRRRRSRRCRPVIRIVESSSCSSISTCRSWSPCSRRRRRSRSCSRRRAITPQPQQPIIVLPIQCQQPAAVNQPANYLGSGQAQQIVLPPIQVQQPGQLISQPAGLPPIQLRSINGAMQPQQLTLPQIQLSSHAAASNMNSSPMIIQSSSSLPQILNSGQIQPVQGGGTIQYVQAAPQSSSALQYVTSERRSVGGQSHVLVNSTNKKPTSIMKTVQRSTSVRDVPQMDLRYGRRPFDWYKNAQKDKIIDENVQVGQ